MATECVIASRRQMIESVLSREMPRLVGLAWVSTKLRFLIGRDKTEKTGISIVDWGEDEARGLDIWNCEWIVF